MFTGCSSIPPAMKIPFLYSFPPPRSSPLSEFSLPPPLVPGIKPNEGPHRILRSQHTINYFFIHFYLDYEETDVTRAFQHAHPRYLALVKRISPLRGWTNWFRSSIARAKKTRVGLLLFRLRSSVTLFTSSFSVLLPSFCIGIRRKSRRKNENGALFECEELSRMT